MKWHIITGEYPPQRGGVSTYTRQVARGLASAGDAVAVWAPFAADRDEPLDAGITVSRLPDTFGPSSRRAIEAALDREPAPRRLLVQYVPHAFGWKGANLPFCRWLASRAADDVWVMFHEVAFPFDIRQSPVLNALAIANRAMATLALRSASRAFVSIPAWRAMLEPLMRRPIEIGWMPVPSGIAVSADPGRVAAIRADANGRAIVGHFGTYPASIRELLAQAIPPLLAATDCRVLLIGPRGAHLRDALVARDPSLADRVWATSGLPERDVSAHLAACDLMIQPYPDGISTRRTSAMAALAHGLGVVATLGPLTEPIWRTSEAVALVDVADPAAMAAEAARLLASPDARARLAAAGRRLYDAHFDLRHTIAALHEPSRAPVCA
ncbi:MAG TPA: glycosyltransferase [Vicinamibacterales bacterium]|nr:glycosyltransferase [Vicinamibacterales bacterium]